MGEFPTPLRAELRALVGREDQQGISNAAQCVGQSREARTLDQVHREAADDQRIVPVGQCAGGDVFETFAPSGLSRARLVRFERKGIDSIDPPGAQIAEGQRHFAASGGKIKHAREVQMPINGEDLQAFANHWLVGIAIVGATILVEATDAAGLVFVSDRRWVLRVAHVKIIDAASFFRCNQRYGTESVGLDIILLMPLSHAQQKALAMQWKAAAPALRKARHADIRRQNNARVIRSLEELSRHVLKNARSRTTSGLVQMYSVLGRASYR